MFIWINMEFLEDKKLSWQAKGILSLLLKESYTFTTRENLTKYGLNKYFSVNESFKELIEKGYIKEFPRRRTKANTLGDSNYLFSKDPIFNSNSKKVILKKGSYYQTYLIKDTKNIYKIGKAFTPKDRLLKLRKELNKPHLELIHIIDRDIEDDLHNIFKDSRIQKEWFSLNKEEVNSIKTF